MGRGRTPLQRCSRCILQPTGQSILLIFFSLKYSKSQKFLTKQDMPKLPPPQHTYHHFLFYFPSIPPSYISLFSLKLSQNQQPIPPPPPLNPRSISTSSPFVFRPYPLSYSLLFIFSFVKKKKFLGWKVNKNRTKYSELNPCLCFSISTYFSSSLYISHCKWSSWSQKILCWLVRFYGISTIVGYLTGNPFLCK